MALPATSVLRRSPDRAGRRSPPAQYQETYVFASKVPSRCRNRKLPLAPKAIERAERSRADCRCSSDHHRAWRKAVSAKQCTSNKRPEGIAGTFDKPENSVDRILAGIGCKPASQFADQTGKGRDADWMAEPQADRQPGDRDAMACPRA